MSYDPTFTRFVRVARRAILGIGFAVLVLFGTCLFAQHRPGEPAAVFSQLLGDLKAQTQVSVLLPSQLPPLTNDSVYAHASGNSDSYVIRIESDPDCDGANACFLGVFRARRSGHLSFPESVALGKNRVGRYKGTSCGGSCSSPAIEWKLNGILYTVQLTLRTGDEKKARTWMVELAKDSILAGPR